MISLFEFCRDAHHGNGLEDQFADNPHVFYISTHLDGAYPWPAYGNPERTGINGTNVNVPLPKCAYGFIILLFPVCFDIPAFDFILSIRFAVLTQLIFKYFDPLRWCVSVARAIY